MFGRKKQRKKFIEVIKLSSLIADNLRVVGDVHFSGGLRIDGRVEGKVIGSSEEKSLVVLSEKGCVVGGIQTYDAVINGHVCGDLEVEHFLELQAGANISGNISYRHLQMDCGAAVDGKLVRAEDAQGGEERGAEVSGPAQKTAEQSESPSRAPADTAGAVAGNEVPPQRAAAQASAQVRRPAPESRSATSSAAAATSHQSGAASPRGASSAGSDKGSR